MWEQFILHAALGVLQVLMKTAAPNSTLFQVIAEINSVTGIMLQSWTK